MLSSYLSKQSNVSEFLRNEPRGIVLVLAILQRIKYPKHAAGYLSEERIYVLSPLTANGAKANPARSYLQLVLQDLPNQAIAPNWSALSFDSCFRLKVTQRSSSPSHCPVLILISSFISSGSRSTGSLPSRISHPPPSDLKT